MYLLHALFEDLGCAIELHEKIANEDTELHSLDPRNYLFNGKKKEIIFLGKKSSMKQVSMTRNIYWYLFAYREFYEKLLVILDEVSLRTYGGKKTSIPNRFCKLFDLHDDGNIHAFLMKLSNNTHSDFELSYQTVMNNQRYTIRSGITRPRQFSLVNIPTMSCITDSIGEGWDGRKIAKFSSKETTLMIDKKRFP